MSKAACEAASLACIFASKVSSANAGVGRAEDAKTHDPASASAMASRFIFTPNFTLDSCDENAPAPRRVPLGGVQLHRALFHLLTFGVSEPHANQQNGARIRAPGGIRGCGCQTLARSAGAGLRTKLF